MHRLLQLMVSVSLVMSVSSVLCCYPSQIAYFNELSGGTESGHRHLLHSNLDWGQDLLNLRRELTPDQNLYLAYCGNFDPVAIGVQYQLPPVKEDSQSSASYLGGLPAGVYAISANLLFGGRKLAPRSNSSRFDVSYDAYQSFQTVPRSQLVGGSIHVFEVDSSSSN